MTLLVPIGFCKIQIQHLLKLNESEALEELTKNQIQIQHLLKLNIYLLTFITPIYHSNTTLVKVK